MHASQMLVSTFFCFHQHGFENNISLVWTHVIDNSIWIFTKLKCCACNRPTTWEAAAVVQKWAEKKILLSENAQIKIILESLFGALGSLKEGLTHFCENFKFDKNTLFSLLLPVAENYWAFRLILQARVIYYSINWECFLLLFHGFCI